MTDNKKAQEAFNQNEWNHYRIEAIEDTIKTWINGVPAAHLIDDKTATGFIALQVHSLQEGQKTGTQIMWKNIKILTENLDEYSKETPIKPVVTKNRLIIDEEKNGCNAVCVQMGLDAIYNNEIVHKQSKDFYNF